MNREYLKVGLTILASLITLLGIKLFVDGAAAQYYIRHWGYWGMLVTAIIAILIAYQTLSTRLPSARRLRSLAQVHRWGLITIGLCSIFTHLHEPHQMKIYMDEPVLSATALMMHKYRQASVPYKAHLLEDQLEVINSYEDKRPYFFAFIISAVHDLTGYRPSNVFIINALLTPLLFLGIYWWTQAVSTRRIAILAVLLFTTLPLLAQNVTGGGFEVMNLVLILALLYCMSRYLKSPGTEWLNLMVITAVLLAQTRYESILFTVPVALCILIKWLRQKEIRLTWFSALAPMLLAAPLIVQQRFFAARVFWQLDEQEGDPFGLEFLSQNLEAAVYYFFNFNSGMTNSLLLSIVIILTLVMLPIVLKKNPKFFTERGEETAFLLLAPFALLNFLLLMLYYWGQMNDPVVSRLGLPFMLVSLMAMPFVLNEILKSRRLPIAVNILVACYILGVTSWANSRAYFSHRLFGSLETKLLLQTVEEYYPNKRVLVIDKAPTPYIVHGYAAYPPKLLGLFSQRMQYLLDKEIYDEILLVKREVIDPETLELKETAEVKLDEYFESERIVGRWYRTQILSSISRVTKVKEISPEKRAEVLKAREDGKIPELEDLDWLYTYTDDPVGVFTSQEEYIEHRQKMFP